MKTKYSRTANAILCGMLISWFLLPGGGQLLPAAMAADETSADLRWPVGAADSQKISITFKETDMREVLNILAYKSGMNIVAGDDVQGKVNVQLKDVPWEQALDIILRTYNCIYRREGNMIRVMSLQRALEEENKTPLTTRIVPLNFAEVDALKESLGKMLTKRGTITVDKRTNVLIVTDIPEAVEMIERAALKLDTLTPQVMIEALMVDVKLTDGEQWGSFLDILDVSNSNEYGHSLAPSSTEVGVLSVAGVMKGLDISGQIGFLVAQDKAQILANPKVITLDNQEAKIEITEEIPYTESVDSGGAVTTTVKFKIVGVKLYVTPHITSGNYISMNVKPEQSFKSSEFSNQPIIDSRKAETNLLVKDGQTIVIGGLRKASDTITYVKIPYVGDIPLFGWLFRKKILSTVESELMLFVTPRIVTTPEFTAREQQMLDEMEKRPALQLDAAAQKKMYPNLQAKIRELFKAEKIADKETALRRESMWEAKRRRVSEAEEQHPEVSMGENTTETVGQPPPSYAEPTTEHQIILDSEAEALKAALQKLKL